jgi:hypothetical protein
VLTGKLKHFAHNLKITLFPLKIKSPDQYRGFGVSAKRKTRSMTGVTYLGLQAT